MQSINESIKDSEMQISFLWPFEFLSRTKLEDEGNISVDSLQHSNFQASKLLVNFQLQGSRVLLDNIGVLGPGSHLWGHMSWVPPRGPRPHFSGMPKKIAKKKY